MLWEMFQQRNIREARDDASKAARDTTIAAKDIVALNSKVDHLALICRAMWSLLRERTDITEQDLIARVSELDLADGVKDNKYRQTRECYNCGRTLGPREENCIYCGVKIPLGNAFNKI